MIVEERTYTVKPGTIHVYYKDYVFARLENPDPHPET